ncbi:PQQ-dependent sugar dehydrogenase [Mesobacillus selenatarsenatis]|uniref:PQQ-dependent sugar dehydrogenase n=1 Tax=Mesobacillus selenatarsenatis TaxID=388741 RepID=A0A846TFK7_9BACI|nr:PQQ-dependent sugar dehydrogenase [Mesobacillus selenatarsenatis]NKE04132.1 PQQ-dependent sugar dehydrogenase [Mesobacillus selenatarsenatis]
MRKVKVTLRPIVSRINLPTVIKSAILPGDSIDSLFIATQPGEIFYIRNGVIKKFLDLRQRVIDLGVLSGGYDERGLLGLAFHPEFINNGLFYLHYSVAGTQGPGARSGSYRPDPCDLESLSLKWENRETEYDHIDAVEEWKLRSNGQPQRRRTLLNLRRPFSNHNGVNSLNFSPETGRLVLTTGDGGSGYDPFNLSQDDMEIAGKIIEMDIRRNSLNPNPPAASRFDELPPSIQESLTIIAKGVRNIPGIAYQRFYNQYIKYAGNVGQDFAESIFSFINYLPVPVSQLTQTAGEKIEAEKKGFINLGWRAWEGAFPTPIISTCSENQSQNQKTIAFYEEAVHTSVIRLHPLTEYYHQEPRSNKYGGTALTGVQPYMGNQIPELSGSVVFTDLSRAKTNEQPDQGFLAYTKFRTDGHLNDFTIIETDYDFGSQSAYYVSLGTNHNQTRLFLGVYGSMKVTDYNMGTVFEIVL